MHCTQYMLLFLVRWTAQRKSQRTVPLAGASSPPFVPCSYSTAIVRGHPRSVLQFYSICAPISCRIALWPTFSRSFVFWQGQRTLGRCCSSRQDVAGCKGRSSSVSSRDASVCIARHRSWRVRNVPPCVECTCCRSCDLRPENACLGQLERLAWVELFTDCAILFYLSPAA